MRAFLSILLVVLQVASASAHKQAEHLRESRSAFGDKLYEAIFHLPETRDAMRKHIPNLDQWIGFEVNFWKKLPEETKQKILDDVGAELDQMKDGGADRAWQRIRDWISIDAQLGLLSTFSGADEGFMDILYEDPLLRPTFKWLLERRPKDFDTKYLGGTFTSGEMAGFYPLLVERLLDAPKPERYACFSRIFARISKDASESQPESAEK